MASFKDDKGLYKFESLQAWQGDKAK